MNWIRENAVLLNTLIGACGLLLSAVALLRIKAVHVELNSRLTQLIKASRAEGAIEERGRALPDDREGNGLLDGLKR